MIQHGQVFKLKTKAADGQPLWAPPLPVREPRLGTTPDRRVRDSPGRGGGASEGVRSDRAGWRTSEHNARRPRRGVPGGASSGAGHDRQAALATRQGDAHSRPQTTDDVRSLSRGG